MKLIDNPMGDYRFLQGIAPYSSGVVAMPGFEIVRIRLQTPVPLKENIFERISQHLSEEGRPIQALCSMELRIPEPLTFEGFKEFNNRYQDMLKDNDLLLGEVNPLARTNISPAVTGITEPSVYALSYTVPVEKKKERPTFIVAGAGDLTDQTDLSTSAIIRPDDISANAMEEKVSMVVKVMTDRLNGLQMNWDAVSSISIYTEVPVHSFLYNTVLKPIGATAVRGTNWYFSNPPIKGLAYEMDMRGLRKELVKEF